MNTPRIVLVAATLEAGNGGIARLARLTARVLARRMREGKLDAQAITLLDAVPQEALGVPVWTAKGSRPAFVAAVQRAALTNTHFIYDSLGPARAHSRIPFFRRPFLAWICGIEVWPGFGPPDLKSSRLKWAARADTLVSISEYTRDRSGLSRAELCWLATESDVLPAPVPVSRPRRVLIVARVDELRKGHQELLECWPRVVAAVPNAILTIAGRGPALDALRLQAAAFPSASSIEVLGFVPDDHMQELWDKTAVFALPSIVEGFGLVYVEAMRQGIPVIATVHDAGQEINVDGVTGFNVDLGQPRELPERLIQLLSDPATADRMGAAGRARWEKHFRFGAFETRLLPILDNFLIP